MKIPSNSVFQDSDIRAVQSFCAKHNAGKRPNSHLEYKVDKNHVLFFHKNTNVTFVGLKVSGKLTIYPFEQALRALANYDIQPVEQVVPKVLPPKNTDTDSDASIDLPKHDRPDNKNTHAREIKHTDHTKSPEKQTKANQPAVSPTQAENRIRSKEQVKALMEDDLSPYHNKKIKKHEYYQIIKQLHARMKMLPHNSRIKHRINTIEKMVSRQEADGVYDPCYGHAVKLMSLALKHSRMILLNNTFSTVKELDSLSLCRLLNETVNKDSRIKLSKLLELSQPAITCIRPTDIKSAYEGEDTFVRKRLQEHYRRAPWLEESLKKK